MVLPALLRRYPTAEENLRLYLVMAAHEAGHVEFGTYRLTLEPLADLVLALHQRYGLVKQVELDTLAALFRLYPHPGLIRTCGCLRRMRGLNICFNGNIHGLQP